MSTENTHKNIADAVENESTTETPETLETPAETIAEVSAEEAPAETDSDDRYRALTAEAKKHREKYKEARDANQVLQDELYDSKKEIIKLRALRAGLFNHHLIDELLEHQHLTLDDFTNEDGDILDSHELLDVIKAVGDKMHVDLIEASTNRVKALAQSAIDEAAFDEYYTETLWDVGISPTEFLDANLNPLPPEVVREKLQDISLQRRIHIKKDYYPTRQSMLMGPKIAAVRKDDPNYFPERVTPKGMVMIPMPTTDRMLQMQIKHEVLSKATPSFQPGDREEQPAPDSQQQWDSTFKSK